MDTTITKPSKKSLCYLAIVLAIALLVFVGLLYYFSRPPKIEVSEEKPVGRSMEEIIESLSAPGEAPESIPKQVQKNLSAPSKKQVEVSENILQSLTAPE